MNRRAFGYLAPLSFLLGSGCGLVLGIDDFTDAEPGGTGGATTGTSSNGGSSSGGSNAGGSPSTSTATANGGGGAGGQAACEVGETQACNTGLLGSCAAGKATCLQDHSGFGPCEQILQPTAQDDCVNNADTTCDGQISCACSPGNKTACTTGLSSACATGTATCKQDGSGYDGCVPDVAPTVDDDCANGVDTNCNGTVDCACTPGDVKPCQTQLPGQCTAGTQACAANGSGYGACAPNVQPGAIAEDCNALGDEDCDGIACSECMWSFIAGDASDQEIASIATDTQGNIYIAGALTGSLKLLNANPAKNVTLNSFGSQDFFLAKLDPSGNVLWGKHFGSAGDDYSGVDVAVSSTGHVAIVGGFKNTVDFGGGAISAPSNNGNTFVAVFDTDGAFQWRTQLGSATVLGRATGVAFDPSGDIVVSGEFRNGSLSVPLAAGGSQSLVNNGSSDVYLVKLTNASSGKAAWARRFGENGGANPSSDSPAAVLVDGSGVIYLTGTFSSSVYFNGSKLTKGDYDVFWAKFDGQGTQSYLATFGSTGSDGVTNLAVDSSGNVVIAGAVSGNVDFGGGMKTVAGPGAIFIAKYGNAGAHQWDKLLNATSSAFGASAGVMTDAGDNILVRAIVSDDFDFGGGILHVAGGPANAPDIVLAKFTPGGGHIWSKIFGDSAAQGATGLAVDPASQGPIVAGACMGTTNFGSGPLTYAGADFASDICIAKFQP